MPSLEALIRERFSPLQRRFVFSFFFFLSFEPQRNAENASPATYNHIVWQVFFSFVLQMRKLRLERVRKLFSISVSGQANSSVSREGTAVLSQSIGLFAQGFI